MTKSRMDHRDSEEIPTSKCMYACDNLVTLGSAVCSVDRRQTDKAGGFHDIPSNSPQMFVCVLDRFGNSGSQQSVLVVRQNSRQNGFHEILVIPTLQMYVCL
ncbi:hypothetical protein AVEN_25706-1 [Araneus ventricosus]|uniref:Uncharacterized protein n=1 Tax=Araneus ventricosus TaxID=182803 RepID=A0A4Y2TTI1_ARAVE|nr:hypothetical protein AVEN_25706-1 [Araneus ventricosus]